MLIKEFGNKNAPVFVALHGGGLSWWSLQKVIDLLKTDYHVITPIIDGHGEDHATTFISIQDSAQKLIAYIDQNCDGQVFALSGLSIGAQIMTEVLSIRPNIAKYAVIESALVYPIKGVSSMVVPTYELCYGLIKKRWFSKMQAKAMCVPAEMFEQYFQDSLKITKQSLINITRSNGNYSLKGSIADTKSKVLIIVGENEIGLMKKSARRLHETIKGSELQIAAAMKHGEMDLCYPDKFVEIIRNFISSNE
jgi:pimeloyl-ACP methyl ester carboxylesterase